MQSLSSIRVESLQLVYARLGYQGALRKSFGTIPSGGACFSTNFIRGLSITSSFRPNLGNPTMKPSQELETCWIYWIPNGDFSGKPSCQMFDDQRLENPIHIPIPFIGDPVINFISPQEIPIPESRIPNPELSSRCSPSPETAPRLDPQTAARDVPPASTSLSPDLRP